MKNKEFISTILLVVVAVIWGTGFPVSKIALNESISPFQVMFYRFSIAAVVMYMANYKKINLNIKSELKSGMIVGLFLFLGFLFQTTGLEHTTPSINAFLTALNVIIAPFIFWIVTKKTVDSYTMVGAVLALIGIGFLTINGEMSINKGDLLTIACAFFFACHIVANGYFTMNKKSDVVTLVFMQIFISAILSFVGVMIIDPITALPSVTGMVSVAYLGVFSTLVCFFLQTMAQEFVDSTKTAIILCTESLWGTIFSILLVGDVLTPKIIIGAVIVFMAIIITETKLNFIKKRG